MLRTINGHKIHYSKVNNKCVAKIRDTKYDVEIDYNSSIAQSENHFVSMFEYMPESMSAHANCHPDDRDDYDVNFGYDLAASRLQMKYWKKYVNVLRDNLLEFNNIVDRLDKVGRSVDDKILDCKCLHMCEFEGCHE